MVRAASAVLLLVVMAWACGGGTPIKETGKAASELKGRVIKGPVANASVTAYRADAALARGELLAQAKADENGDFVLALPAYQGHVLVVATGGSYVEEAIGLGVQLGDNELQLLLPDFTTGTKLEGLRLTPVSTLAVAFTRFHVAGEQAVAAAHSDALQHLHQHFGGVDWASVTPADLTVAGVTNLSPEAKAGLVLSGLSWLSKMHAEASDVSPGLVVNAATLTTALSKDAADGTLDGLSAGAAVQQAKASLSGLTLRSGLVQAVTGFVNSPRNASALQLQDITAFLAAIGTDNDPYLFCPGGVPAASCGSGPVDTEPPTLAFVRPTSGAGVAGSTQVEVHASDNVKLRDLRFTAPPSLVATTPTFTAEGREATLTATLDVSALPDGPLDIRAEATDESGNPAAKAITVTVSNTGPRITLTAPADGATVRGASVLVTAQAEAQAPGATIARIDVVHAPPGFGSDSLPASDVFAAAWDTTQALEGLTTLTLRAVDSFGTQTETSIAVTVDNVPFGQVSAVVSAGAPLDGLTVKLVAIDDMTGEPVTGRLGGPILGQSSAVTVDGGVTFELTQENWTGPVQLVAQGSSVTYVDPSDGVSTVSLPSAFALTSYVDSYRAGDRLERPVTYWTTLADLAAHAYALGRNPTQPTPGPLSAALAIVDPLFARHIATATWSARTTSPASLTHSSQSLRDVVYAAFPDVALNQEARDLALQVGLTPGTGFGAPQLVSLLEQDLADGQFDGRSLGAQLSTAGTTPYALDANTPRFYQAIALDRFIRGPQNLTQLTRQDLQTSSIYDTISMDTSLLFPASQQPIPFDNVPPTVTFSVTFTNNSVTLSPVGPSRLVAGTVHVEATAADATGVASLTLAAGSTALTPATGSGPTHFLGDFSAAAYAEGPLTLTATACDPLANCGPTTLVLEVDRTPPQVQALKPTLPPAGLFASAAFELEATASDSNGVYSVDCQSPAGVADQDAAADRYYAPASAWTLSWADGPANVTFRACDLVRNCGSTQLSLTVDKTPPTLAWVQQPPANTKNDLVTFAVSADDGAGAGVKRVLAGVDYLSPVEGVRSGNTWTFINFNLGAIQGPRHLRVWAEDLAVPTNSGQGGAAVNDLLATVLLDKAPPQLLPASYKTFKDEDGITLVTDGTGRPVVPAQYHFGSAPARTIDLSQGSVTIKKASTLTSWSANRPTLTWRIPFTAATDSPITGVTWSAVRNSCRPDTGTCGNSSGGSGSLTLDTAVPSPQANSAYYSLELVWPEKGTYLVTFIATDAAGNATTEVRLITWDVVGPPLVVLPDTAWEASGDPQALQTLRLNGSGTTAYSRMFGVGLGGYVSNVVRAKRYLVYNAAPVDVAISFALAGTATRTTNESWLNLLGNLYGAEGAGGYTVDGQSFDRDAAFTGNGQTYWCPHASRLVEPYPCPITATNLPYARHVRGQLQQYECYGNVRTEVGPTYGPARLNNTTDSLAGHTNTGVTTLSLSPASAPGSGNETTLAGAVQFGPTTGGARVPAASSGAPGVTAVYVGVPVQPHTTPLTTVALPHLAANGQYQYYYADTTDSSGLSVPQPASWSCDSPEPPSIYQTWVMWWWYRRLNAATTTINASWTVQSGGNFFVGGLTGTETYAGTTPRVLQSLGSSATVTH